MLTNLDSLPLARIHNMLKMFLSTEERYDFTEVELRRFLSRCVWEWPHADASNSPMTNLWIAGWLKMASSNTPTASTRSGGRIRVNANLVELHAMWYDQAIMRSVIRATD